MRLATLALVLGATLAWADEPGSPSEALERTIVRVAARAAPSLVSIEVSRISDVDAPGTTAPGNAWQRLLQNAMRGSRGMHVAYAKRPAGPVAGFFVREGLVLTSWYNIAGQLDGLRVMCADGIRRPAQLLGSDQARDVALLRVENAAAIPVLPLAPDAAPRIGSFAVVCDGGATSGIVSAISRERGTALQLDARINYGNSGAPVLDLRGRVLGVAGRVYHWSTSGQNSGVGYATTSTYLAKIFDDLAAGVTIKGPRQALLGVSGKDADEAGVVVEVVTPGGAAANAGIVVGDRLVVFDGVRIDGLLHLVQQVGGHQPGVEVEVIVVRAGARLTLKAILGERKEGE